jgi:dienelactone hydrolase
MNQYLASQGYVVLSINYRSGIGYGMDFREAINYGAAGASEFNDVEGAGLYLRARPDVDPAHIGLWGGSYGGYLTALGLARASSLFAGGMDFHGVHDWTSLGGGGRGAAPGGGAPTASAEAAREESADPPFYSGRFASLAPTARFCILGVRRLHANYDPARPK